MEIVNKLKSYVNMQDVELGECFIYKDYLYMRISDKCLYKNYPNNVINLETNELNAIADDVPVRRVNAKIVIE